MSWPWCSPARSSRREVGEIGRRQQLAIGPGGLRQIGQFRVVAADSATELFELTGKRIKRTGDARRGRAERVLIEHQHMKISQPGISRRWQSEFVADALRQWIGAG